jgi:hypothetical protein
MSMAPQIEIHIDPSFAEEAVFLELSAQEGAVDRGMAQAFHTERSALYGGQGSAEQRAAAFHHLAARYFRELGLAELFAARLDEAPLVTAHVQAVIVRRVFCRKDERVELYVLPGSQAPRDAEGPATLLIDLQVVRCRDRGRLVAWLRHELMHVSDMLDPAFAYMPHPELSGEYELEDDLIRERFRLLWDLSVEGRMRRRGWPTTVDQPVRRREFERMSVPWAPERREAVWRDLGTRARWTQRELLQLAQDERLTRMLGQGGIRCPLCHFPTREGVRDWSHERAAVAEAIRADYPAWRPSHGACLQCVELYRSRLQLA